jgi:predicted hydrocarbon binding protein
VKLSEEKKDEEDTTTSNYTTAFFILPAEALLKLRSELEPLANEDVIRAIIFRYGFRSGEACVESMGVSVSSPKKLKDLLPDIWEEVGLGRLHFDSQSSDTIKLRISESIEGNIMGETEKTSCDFTRGYLAGVISELLGKMFHCKEEDCVSKGDLHCSFLLTERGER